MDNTGLLAIFNDYPGVLYAICIWREARDQPDIARHGVGWVIMNRCKKENAQFPNTPIEVMLQKEEVDVIFKKNQFSSFNPGDPNASKLPQPTDPADWIAFQHCCIVVTNLGPDPTKGAVYYESYPEAQLPEVRAKCPWFAANKMTVQLGAIRFYHA